MKDERKETSLTSDLLRPYKARGPSATRPSDHGLLRAASAAHRPAGGAHGGLRALPGCGPTGQREREQRSQ